MDTTATSAYMGDCDNATGSATDAARKETSTPPTHRMPQLSKRVARQFANAARYARLRIGTGIGCVTSTGVLVRDAYGRSSYTVDVDVEGMEHSEVVRRMYVADRALLAKGVRAATKAFAIQTHAKEVLVLTALTSVIAGLIAFSLTPNMAIADFAIYSLLASLPILMGANAALLALTCLGVSRIRRALELDKAADVIVRARQLGNYTSMVPITRAVAEDDELLRYVCSERDSDGMMLSTYGSGGGGSDNALDIDALVNADAVDADSSHDIVRQTIGYALSGCHYLASNLMDDGLRYAEEQPLRNLSTSRVDEMLQEAFDEVTDALSRREESADAAERLAVERERTIPVVFECDNYASFGMCSYDPDGRMSNEIMISSDALVSPSSTMDTLSHEILHTLEECQGSSDDAHGEAFKRYAQIIREETGGRIDITPYYETEPLCIRDEQLYHYDIDKLACYDRDMYEYVRWCQSVLKRIEKYVGRTVRYFDSQLTIEGIIDTGWCNTQIVASDGDGNAYRCGVDFAVSLLGSGDVIRSRPVLETCAYDALC